MDRRALSLLLLLLLGLGIAACGGPSPAPSAEPTARRTFSEPELKYVLLDQVGPISYCDPDVWPLAREVPDSEVAARVADLRAADPSTYSVIVHRLGVGRGPLSPQAERSVYTELKRLRALTLTPAPEGLGFDYTVAGDAPRNAAQRVRGTITVTGVIAVHDRAPNIVGCPKCLAMGTPISTPAGPIAVERLSTGDLVWTLDGAGDRVAAPLVLVAAIAAPHGHRVVHLVLADGREVTASPGHPLADGRPIGSLRPGAPLDGSTARSAVSEPYRAARTYDILPAGLTGVYLAGGILLGSTLRVAKSGEAAAAR
jgi:hypothetical protein